MVYIITFPFIRENNYCKKNPGNTHFRGTDQQTNYQSIN